MSHTVTKPFRAVEPGQVYPREFKVGEVISDPRLVEVAKELGAAAPTPTPKPAAKAAPASKSASPPETR